MEDSSVSLATKPGAALRISKFLPTEQERGSSFSHTLVVFLNGLGLPRAAWLASIGQCISHRREAGLPIPPVLAYDRYGQGDSDPDPSDPTGTPYGHDARAVVADLHQLLTQVCQRDLGATLDATRLVLICNSIGCPLARLYAAAHPGSVAGFLFLDSMMANTDFVSLLPDPDASGFDPSQLPQGLSVEDVRQSRDMIAKFFHPSLPNRERFDRRNMAELLPDADGPALPPGPGGKSAYLVVVGHDLDTFAEQSEKGPMATPAAITNTYTNPAWTAYNAGLTRLVADQDKVESKLAKGCGHFIQKDDPAFVASELGKLLDKLASA